MLLGTACENIAYPHDLPHKIFTWSCVLSRHKQPPNLWILLVEKEPHPGFDHQAFFPLASTVHFLI